MIKIQYIYLSHNQKVHLNINEINIMFCTFGIQNFVYNKLISFTLNIIKTIKFNNKLKSK